MCVVFLITKHPRFKLVIAGNRDEYLDRPTSRAHFWPEAPQVLGGTDTANATNYRSQLMGEASKKQSCGGTCNGTWMGITRQGRFGFVTNVRQHPKTISPDAQSRGVLVRDYLLGSNTTHSYTDGLQLNNFNGFNLVLGRVDADVYYVGNKDHQPVRVLQETKIYGISNGSALEANDKWPKVVNGKQMFEKALEEANDVDELVERLFAILGNSDAYDELPEGMFDYELEKVLSPICISKERTPKRDYGTRTHTVIVVDHNNKAVFAEKDLMHGLKEFEFNIDESQMHNLVEKTKRFIPPLSALHLHKGQSGRIAVVGGSAEYTGAPYYCAMASLRTGSDLCHVLCSSKASAVIKGYSPELVVHPCITDSNDGIQESVASLIPRLDCMVVGPGLSRDPVMQHYASLLIRHAVEAQIPLVIDADGLHSVQKDPSLIHGYTKAVLTPNKSEFTRLCESQGIQSTSEPLEALCKALGNVTVMLKGETDVVSDGRATVECVTEWPKSPRRCGGQGDILAGVIATFVGWTHGYSKNRWTKAVEMDSMWLNAVYSASAVC